MAFGPPLIPRNKKKAFFAKEFPEANFSVAAFLETHHKNEDDFPDVINEYCTHHHCIHAPTPPDNKHNDIILLVNKQYDNAYGAMVKQTIVNVDKLNILDKTTVVGYIFSPVSVLRL